MIETQTVLKVDDEWMAGSTTGRHTPSKPVLLLTSNGTGGRSNDETQCLMVWLMV